MGGEIIAEKFALLKTRGGNGVAVTHLVEDTLLGERAVVKVSEGLEDLCLEYLKAFNLARALDLPGMLMPLEGGLLEEEEGYYMAFPEVGEPSLEDYLRMGGPLGCGEIMALAIEILRILQGLHGAGFVHLFINPRNVFYRPRGRVLLKDPALRSEFFARFLEEVAVPDFYFFSPPVMDGGEAGPEADLFALGRLVERLLLQARDGDSSPCGAAAAELAQECMGAADNPGALSAGELLERYRFSMAGGEGGATAGEAEPGLKGFDAAVGNRDSRRKEGGGRVEGAGGTASGPEGPWSILGSRASRSSRGFASSFPEGGHQKRRGTKVERRFPGRKGKRFRAAALSLCAILCLALVGGTALSFLPQGGEKAPAGSSAGGSYAGEEVASPAALLGRHRAWSESEDDPGPGGDGEDITHSWRGDIDSSIQEGAAMGKGAVSPGEGDDFAVKERGEAPAGPPLPSQGSAGALPVASFTLLPDEGRSPLQVLLDASASHDPDGHIVSYAWSCGGGGVSIYHVFESNVIPVRIPVTLTVTDDAGNSSSTTRYVTLY